MLAQGAANNSQEKIISGWFPLCSIYVTESLNQDRDIADIQEIQYYALTFCSPRSSYTNMLYC